MITKANLLAAAGSIVMGPGGVVNFAVGCSVARTATGTYNVLVDEAQTVPPQVGGLFATMDAAAASEAFLIDGGWVPIVTHVGDTFTGTAGAPTTAEGSVPPQTLFTILTVVTSAEEPFDLIGNLAFKVLAIGGGNPQDPSQTGI